MKHNPALIAKGNTTGKLASELQDELNTVKKPGLSAPRVITGHRMFNDIGTPQSFATKRQTSLGESLVNGRTFDFRDIITAIANSHSHGRPDVQRAMAQAEYLEAVAKGIRDSAPLFLEAVQQVQDWEVEKYDYSVLVAAVSAQNRHEASVTQIDLQLGQLQANDEERAQKELVRDAEVVALKKENKSLSAKFKSFMAGDK
jgi:hypothetical protein